MPKPISGIVKPFWQKMLIENYSKNLLNKNIKGDCYITSQRVIPKLVLCLIFRISNGNVLPIALVFVFLKLKRYLINSYN